MFTGIVLAIGTVESIETGADGDATLRVACPTLPELAAGDSIAVNGCCLTATAPSAGAFTCDASRETLSLTTLGDLEPGSRVNLEPALTLQTALGGHLVSGHVDGIATLATRRPEARSVRFEFDVPSSLSRYVARKGSVCINGVSLTVNEVDGARFGVNIVPHTLEVTTFDALQPGDRANFEVDQVARYLERLLEARAQ